MSEYDDELKEGADDPEEDYVKKQFGLLLYRLQKLTPRSRARLQSDFTQKMIDSTLAVETPKGPLFFVLLGKTSGGRAMTVLTKQPATIEWIDSFQPGSVFWDIGASVGVFSVYAALATDTRVVAFEPAAVNYYLLSANCEANKLQDRVDCLLIGVGKQRSIARLEVSQFRPARSFSFRGKRDQPYEGRQAAVVLSIDELVEEYGVPCPNYIKIDAPGASEDIIAGATRTFRRPEVRQIHLEVRDSSKGGQRILEMLNQSGFAPVSKDTHGGSADVTFARRA
ncbi:MAG TPA: FkbM family methyltransferase [Vicinamibacterales bacterium]|nr:FkbM family methyltransferase [Vicinamibacterales bacterium]